MRKTYLTYAGVGILVIVAIVMMFTRHSSTLKENIRDFIPADIHSLDQIIIKGQGKKIILQKNPLGWELASQGLAKKEMVELFLASLSRLEIVAPAAKSGRESVIDYLRRYGRQVSLFHGGREMRSFYVGYDSIPVPGTYILDSRHQRPYRVDMKGYPETNIENLFSLNAENWKKNSILGYAPTDILQVTVEYTEKPSLSYRINRDAGGKLTLYSLSPSPRKQPAVEQNLKDYLSFFNEISYLRAPHSLHDQLLPGKDFARLYIHLRNGQDFLLRACFYFPDGLNKQADKDQFAGITSPGNDTMLFKYTDLDPVFQRLSDFQKMQ